MQIVRAHYWGLDVGGMGRLLILHWYCVAYSPVPYRYRLLPRKTNAR